MNVKSSGVKVVPKDRKERSDKKKRIAPYFTQRESFKLNRLAQAVNINDTELLILMYRTLIDNPGFVRWVQEEKFKISKDDPFYIKPYLIDGEIQYGQREYFPDDK